MGNIYEYQCRCGYKEKVQIGCGMNAINRTMMKMVFPEEFPQVSGQAGQLSMENSLAYCAKCKKLMEVATLLVKKEDGNRACFLKRCATCGSLPEVIADAEQVKCPKCGAMMERKSCGLWD